MAVEQVAANKHAAREVRAAKRDIYYSVAWQIHATSTDEIRVISPKIRPAFTSPLATI
jgi:hypothetical protein